MEYTKPESQSGPLPARYKNPLFFLVPILVIGVVGALCALIYWYPPATVSIRSGLNASATPDELANAWFLSEEPLGTVAYRVDGKKFVRKDIGGLLLSASFTPSGVAQVIKESDGTFRVLLNDQELLATTTAVLGVSSAPDERQVALSLSTTAEVGIFPAGLPYASVRPTEWNAYTLSVETGTLFMMGTGNHGLFVSGHEIVRTTPKGVYSFDNSTGSSTQLLERDFSSVPLPTLVSPDRTKVALVDGATRVLTIYEVSGSSFTEMEQVPFEGRIMSFALGNDGHYILRTSKWGTEILKRDFGGSEYRKVMTVPEHLKVNRLLISSL